MAGESSDGAFYALMRIVINLAAIGVSAGIVALIVAAIVVEMD